MSFALTDEQRKIVEDNHNLIYQFISDRKLDLSEYYDLLAITLCKAIINYDSSKGAISTCAYAYFDNAVKTYWRDENSNSRKINHETLSLDYYFSPVNSNNDETECNLLNLVYDDFDLEEFLIEESFRNALIEKIKKRLTTKEQCIFKELLSGKAQVDIAKERGCSRQNISYVWIKAIKYGKELIQNYQK